MQLGRLCAARAAGVREIFRIFREILSLDDGGL